MKQNELILTKFKQTYLTSSYSYFNYHFVLRALVYVDDLISGLICPHYKLILLANSPASTSRSTATPPAASQIGRVDSTAVSTSSAAAEPPRRLQPISTSPVRTNHSTNIATTSWPRPVLKSDSAVYPVPARWPPVATKTTALMRVSHDSRVEIVSIAADEIEPAVDAGSTAPTTNSTLPVQSPANNTWTTCITESITAILADWSTARYMSLVDADSRPGGGRLVNIYFQIPKKRFHNAKI